MSRRVLALLAALALGAVAPAFAAGPAAPSWAQTEIEAVVARGLMGADATAFRPNAALTQRELAELVAGLTQQPVAEVASPSAPVRLAVLDGRLVRGLRLGDAARRFDQGARDAGLQVPSRFGTEVVARLLGLRTDHPAARDDLELLPSDPATRAEAAFSAARLLKLDPARTQSIRDLAPTFVLPALSPLQARILTTALGLVGYPYVWGGTSERAKVLDGVPTRGGFDCSGFVWRVYKLQTYARAPGLAEALHGRTTYAMSGEIPPSLRIPLAKLQPADLLFFGARGTRSKPAEIDHAAVYLGAGWFVNSSSVGVAVGHLSGWYAEHFAWARRPLAEAGL